MQHHGDVLRAWKDRHQRACLLKIFRGTVDCRLARSWQEIFVCIHAIINIEVQGPQLLLRKAKGSLIHEAEFSL
jgi:hypothetical protein